MAFLRQEKKKSGTYLRIIQSYRSEDGKSRHRTLYNLGKAEDYSPSALKKIGQTLYELGDGTIEELEQKMIHEISRYNYGFPLAIKKLLQIYSLDTFFKAVSRRKDLNYNLSQSVNLLISERLNDPVSKLSNYHNQYDYLGLEKMELQHIYRTLDHLNENQEQVKKLIFSKGRNLFNQQLDIVFYDVTTFYFDSDKEDGFREKGFGKDGKIGKTIIAFGLLIDQNKQPVGYEVYRGKQYEGHTFADAVTRLKKKYHIGKVICVADTGMMNKDNRELTQGAEYEYIFGERLKNLAQGIQNEILDLSKYQELKIDDIDSDKPVVLRYYITTHQGRKLITTYSSKRAEKDKKERETKIEKAKLFLEHPDQLGKKAKAFYLKKEGDSTYTLDIEKIQHSQRFDGFMCIATNNKDLPTEKILDAYKQLYKIEQSFRCFKTFLETRPMYHWTEPRILGHLALCYISFTILNYLQLKLKKKGEPQSEDNIRKNLQSMQVSLISQNNEEYYLRSKSSSGAKQIMRELGIRQMPDLVPRKSILQYL